MANHRRPRARSFAVALAAATLSVPLLASIMAAAPAAAQETPPQTAAAAAQSSVPLPLSASRTDNVIPEKTRILTPVSNPIKVGDVTLRDLGPGAWFVAVRYHADLVSTWTASPTFNMSYSPADFHQGRSPHVTDTLSSGPGTWSEQLVLVASVGLFNQASSTSPLVETNAHQDIVKASPPATLTCTVPVPGDPTRECPVTTFTLASFPFKFDLATIGAPIGNIEGTFDIPVAIALKLTEQGLTLTRTASIGSRSQSTPLSIGGAQPASADDAFTIGCDDPTGSPIGYQASNAAYRLAGSAVPTVGLDARDVALTGQILGNRTRVPLLDRLHIGSATLPEIPLGSVTLHGATAPTTLGSVLPGCVGAPTVSIADAAPIAEPPPGQAQPVDFKVTLSAPSTSWVGVPYHTVDGTAVAARDYTAQSDHMVWFAPRETSKTITVWVRGDTIGEPTETFAVVLTTSPQAFLGRARAQGTILGVQTVSIADATPVAEPPTGQAVPASFNVTLSAPSTSWIGVPYHTVDGTAVAGLDYTAQSGHTVWFAPGETSKTITVWVRGDNVNEPTETFGVVFAPSPQAVLGRAQAQGTILDLRTTTRPFACNDVPRGTWTEQATVVSSSSSPFGLVEHLRGSTTVIGNNGRRLTYPEDYVRTVSIPGGGEVLQGTLVFSWIALGGGSGLSWLHPGLGTHAPNGSLGYKTGTETDVCAALGYGSAATAAAPSVV